MTEHEIAPLTGPAWLPGMKIEAPIDSVLVMEDRAQVTRRAEIRLQAGRNSLACWPLTPLVADQTLRCRIRGAGNETAESDPPKVIDVQLKRRYLVKASRPEKEREITVAIEKLADEYLDVYDRTQVVIHRHKRNQEISAGTTQYISDRLAVGPFDPEWPDQIDKLFRRRAELETEMLEDQHLQDDRLERLDRLEQERYEALQPVSDYQAGLITEIQVPQDGSYLVEWEYQVPCALWRPDYTAEIEDGQKTAVRWQSSGTVWQASGEDWRNIELSFSTARPTLGAKLPLLSDDVLASRQKTDHEKKVIEVTSRDEVIQKTSTVEDEKQSDTPPGLDDGGEARTYRVPEKVDVPGDGRPHRLQFESWRAEAESGLVCLPEKAGFVFLRSLQSNVSNMPLLAGPVTLIRNGGYIGRSKIGYIAQGEKFSLSWGSEDGLVVLRDVVHEFDETKLRKYKKYNYRVKSYLANYTGGGRDVLLSERIPVSEIEQVEIKLIADKSTAGFEKDDQGLLTWQIELADGEEKTVKLAFEVGMPSKVIWDG